MGSNPTLSASRFAASASIRSAPAKRRPCRGRPRKTRKSAATDIKGAGGDRSPPTPSRTSRADARHAEVRSYGLSRDYRASVTVRSPSHQVGGRGFYRQRRQSGTWRKAPLSGFLHHHSPPESTHLSSGGGGHSRQSRDSRIVRAWRFSHHSLPPKDTHLSGRAGALPRLSRSLVSGAGKYGASRSWPFADSGKAKASSSNSGGHARLASGRYLASSVPSTIAARMPRRSLFAAVSVRLAVAIDWRRKGPRRLEITRRERVTEPPRLRLRCNNGIRAGLILPRPGRAVPAGATRNFPGPVFRNSISPGPVLPNSIFPLALRHRHSKLYNLGRLHSAVRLAT